MVKLTAAVVLLCAALAIVFAPAAMDQADAYAQDGENRGALAAGTITGTLSEQAQSGDLSEQATPSATTISPNTNYTGTLYQKGKTSFIRYYKLTLGSRSRVSLYYGTDVVPQYYSYCGPAFVIYTASAMESSESETYRIAIEKSKTFTSKNLYLDAGTYYIGIFGHDDSNAWNHSYTFRANVAAVSNAESEPSNSSSSARSIAVNASYAGSFWRPREGNGSDDDWFKFTVKKRSRVSLSVNTDIVPDYYSYCGPTAYIYTQGSVNSTGNETYSIPISGSKQWKSGNLYLDVGTYYVRLYSHRDSNVWGHDYKFTVNATAVAASEREPHSDYSTAVPVASGAAVAGSFYAPTTSSSCVDNDWFRFVVKKKSQVRLSVSTNVVPNHYSYCGPTAYVYTAQSLNTTEEPSYTLAIGGSKSWSQTLTLAPGTYYVKLFSHHDSNVWGRDYKFLVDNLTYDLSRATVSVANQTYTGKARTPNPVVKFGGRTLKKDVDYAVNYRNNVALGTATCYILGRGAYVGMKTATFMISKKPPSVYYRTHVQRVGWQKWVKDGSVAGTTGRSLRLEGMNVKLGSKPYSGTIQYRTHIQTYGWEKTWKSDGAQSGTTGKSKRLEAMQVRLTGELAKHYDVYYRVHAQHFGWMGWAKNGQRAGTAGFSYRLEGMQIKIVPKGAKAPGSTANCFRQR